MSSRWVFFAVILVLTSARAGEPECTSVELGSRDHPLDGALFILGVIDLDDNGIDEVVLRTSTTTMSVVSSSGCFDYAQAVELEHPGSVSTRSRLATGDFDGDGATDLAVANSGDLVWYRGLGGGALSSASIIDHDGPAVASADLDGDGRDELIASGSPRNGLVVMSPVDGVMTVVATIGDAGFAAAVLALDVNQDQAPDVLAVDDGSELHLYLNDGAGGFSLIPDDTLTVTNEEEVIAVAIDATTRGVAYTGDGALDIYAIRGGAFVQVLAVIDPLVTTESRQSAFPLDVDVRGLAVMSGLDHAVVRWNDGGLDATLTRLTPESFVRAAVGRGATPDEVAIIMTDLTNPARLVVQRATQDEMRMGVEFVSEDIDATTIASADFDSDGFIDVVTSGGGIRLYHGGPDGALTWDPADDLAINSWVVRAADLTGDDVDDLVLVNTVGIIVVPGDGAGGWLEPLPEAPLGGPVFDIEARDFDGDGDLDAAAVQRDLDAVLVYENLGDGTLELDATYEGCDFCQLMAVDDLDGDGHFDIVGNSTDEGPGFLRLDGVGDGTFVAGEPILLGNDASAVIPQTGDWTGDGRADLVALGFLDGNVIVVFLENDGIGNFALVDTVPLGPPQNYIGLELIDLDGDGTPEALVGAPEGVRAYGRDANGQWHPIDEGHVPLSDVTTIARRPGDISTPGLLVGSQSDPGLVEVTIDCPCPASNPCPADLTGLDGQVNFDDLLVVLGQWGPCVNPFDCTGDVDGDLVVGFTDLLLVLSTWGPCAP